jgi:GTP-binding protein
MKQPRVLIVGRPNVGKSTLFNRLAGERKAIELDVPGVTRDMVEHRIVRPEGNFILLDSAGVFLEDNPDTLFQQRVEDLLRAQLDKVDVILFLTDYQSGLLPADFTIARALRPYQNKVVVVVNKVDTPQSQPDLWNFSRLGLGDPVAVSATHNIGMGRLVSAIVAHMDVTERPQIPEKPARSIRLAIVGRPNMGKSSLINAMLNDERVLVDDKAGTTRDAVDTIFYYEGQPITLIDTAGLKRKARQEDFLESLTMQRTMDAVHSADLVVVVLSADQFLNDFDKKIIRSVLDAHRNMILFVNKWDLTDRTHELRQGLEKYAQRMFPHLEYVPFIFGSAKAKHQLHKIVPLALDIIAQSQVRIPTAALNKMIESALRFQPPPPKRGKALKFYYATQAEVQPPTFVFFVNDATVVDSSYTRFVENRLRAEYPNLMGVAIVISFRSDNTPRQTGKQRPRK